MRVLHVALHLDVGGLERLIADIVRLTRADRIESQVLCLSHLGRNAEVLDDIAPLHVARTTGRASMLWPAGLIRQIAAIAPDVVHTHSGVWYKASLAARRAGVGRLIHTEHGRHFPDPLSARVLDALAARRTDVAVAVSESVAEYLRQRVVRDRAEIVVIRNGVDSRLYRPRPYDGWLHDELSLPGDRPLIGSLGRFDPIKGYDVMIGSFALLLRLWSDGAEPVLVLAGEGSEERSLRELARESGVEDSIRFVGWRSDTPRFAAALDLFTLASWSEGTSVSLLETMAAGVCPVVTKVGGNAAILGDTLAHRLVTAGDPTGLADAWRAALADPESRRADGRAARARVESEYSLARMVAAYERLYLTEQPSAGR